MLKQDLLGAHIDTIWLADTQQALFNSLMQVMARPGGLDNWSGWIKDSKAYLAVLAILMDGEVSLADVDGLLTEQDWPLLQAKIMTTERAHYILCDGSRSPNFQPKLGTLSSPDFAATLIIKVSQLDACKGDIHLKLSGPGVDGQSQVYISGLDQAWLEARNEWCGAFPLGIDCILVDDTRIMGLPRTTRIEIFEATGNKELS